MNKLFKEIRGILTSLYVYSKNTINKQILFIFNKYHSLPHKIKKSFYYFIQGVSVYRKTVLVINILAFLNLIFTIIIIIAFSNVIEEGSFIPVALISSIFIKFAPVFIQELLFTYYFTITSFIKTKLREIILNVINFDKVEITPVKTNQSLIGQSNILSNESSLFHTNNTQDPLGEALPPKSVEDIKKPSPSEDKTYIYWAIGILCLLTIAGVTYYFYYGGAPDPKDDKTMPSLRIKSIRRDILDVAEEWVENAPALPNSR